eukprot:gb/GECG01000196.1/.p1 GENE.gb/GECG01000196.1/~~gb/GECG01000196.1/.p1  ORF type:complete len:308 (+),score=49.56 gb/GECG01000196.1/:1-924(+)
MQQRQPQETASNTASGSGQLRHQLERRKKEESSSAQLQEAIQARKKLEREVFQLECELCVKPKVTTDRFVQICQWLTPQKFEEILEERVLALYCGNATCGASISQTQKDRFRKLAKVTEYKNSHVRLPTAYCSTRCCKMAAYAHAQLSEVPPNFRLQDGISYIVDVSPFCGQQREGDRQNYMSENALDERVSAAGRTSPDSLHIVERPRTSDFNQSSVNNFDDGGSNLIEGLYISSDKRLASDKRAGTGTQRLVEETDDGLICLSSMKKAREKEKYSRRRTPKSNRETKKETVASQRRMDSSTAGTG